MACSARIIMHRLGHPEWADAAASTRHTWIGAFNTWVLLTSSLTAVLRASCGRAGRRTVKAARFLNLFTILGALTFIAVIKSFEWYERRSVTATRSPSNTFWSFYYTAAGLHALHVIAGAAIMGVVAFDAFRGRELHRVELIGIYWHFVDVVWIFLFPLLYIAK